MNIIEFILLILWILLILTKTTNLIIFMITERQDRAFWVPIFPGSSGCPGPLPCRICSVLVFRVAIVDVSASVEHRCVLLTSRYSKLPSPANTASHSLLVMCSKAQQMPLSRSQYQNALNIVEKFFLKNIFTSLLLKGGGSYCVFQDIALTLLKISFSLKIVGKL